MLKSLKSTLLCLLGISTLSNALVEQVRLALTGNASQMLISWVTDTTGQPNLVQVGTASGQYNFGNFTSTNVTSYSFSSGIAAGYQSGDIHTVLVTGLASATRYYYICGNGTDNSKEFSFKTQSVTPQPVSLGLIGDIGQTENSQLTTRAMTTDNIDLVLLVGDLSYANGLQPKWDTYGRIFEYSTAAVPWMLLPGNHENEGAENYAFTAYQTRFTMPSNGMPASEKNLYYSFDYSWAHIIALSTETAYTTASDQYTWFVNDIENVNRTKTPWLIVMFHRPYYNTNYAHQNEVLDFRTTYEPLFLKYCVDIVLCGHIHAYERTFPVYNDQVGVNFPQYFNIGNGGNQEGLVYNYYAPTAWSAFRKAAYGYSRQDMFNETHILHQWFANQYEFSALYSDNIIPTPVEDRVPLDTVWVVKDYPRGTCTN